MQTPNRLDDYEWPEEWRRKVIVCSICTGTTNNDIVDKLKLPLRIIQRIRKQLVDSDVDVEAVTARKTQDRAEQRVRSSNFISNVQQLIDNDPFISICEVS